MNVLALTTWCPYPMVNGSTIREYFLLRALAEVHDVNLVTFSVPTAPSTEQVEHLRSFCASVAVLPKDPFAPVPGQRSTFLSSTPRSFVETYDPAMRPFVLEHVARADVAVGFQLSAARYLTDLPVPTVFDEAEPRQIRNQVTQASSWTRRARAQLTWWKHARYLQRVSAGMAAVSVVSELERETLIEAGVDPVRAHVIPNGADPDDLGRPRTPVEPPRVIYPGAITFAPNLEAVRWCLEYVMPRLKAVRADIEFWVTGDTGDIALKDLPNAEWVTFTGRLPDVKAAISDAAVTVIPLLSGSGTRLKVLESLALGTPVVSTARGSEGLLANDGEHLLIADAPEAFASAVLRILGDPVLAGRLSAAGRARVESEYTWDAIGRRFRDVVTAAARPRLHQPASDSGH